MTDLAKQEPAAPVEEVPLGDVEPDVIAADVPVTAVPLWRVRLRLMRRTLSRNWALFAENKIGFVGLAIIAIFALMAMLQPILIATVWDPRVYDPQTGYDAVVTEFTVVEEVTDPTTEIDVQTARLETTPFVEVGDVIEVPLQPAPPTFTGEYPHFLGTDPLGRDILSQLMYGARAAFFLGSVAALVTVVIATTVGSVAAHFGGWIDTLADEIRRLHPRASADPGTDRVSASLFAISMPLLGLLIGILGGFGGVAIVLKSQALSVRVKPFIDAARVAGGGDWHVIFRHIVPNVLPLSFLYMMFTVTEAISLEATLSFLGLLNVPMSWGIMINTAATQGYLLGGTDYWWLLLPAGLAVTLLAFAFFLVGRAMDEVVNPRLRAR